MDIHGVDKYPNYDGLCASVATCTHAICHYFGQCIENVCLLYEYIRFTLPLSILFLFDVKFEILLHFKTIQNLCCEKIFAFTVLLGLTSLENSERRPVS